MKLNEILRESSTPTEMTEDQIKAWLTDLDSNLYDHEIGMKDGKVNVSTDLRMTGTLGEITELPLRFGFVSGDFEVGQNYLTTMEGFPELVGKDLVLTDLPISSFEHCPKKIGDSLYAANTKITSLVGIHNHIKTLGHNKAAFRAEFLLNWERIKEGGLGLVLINSTFRLTGPGVSASNYVPPRPFQIIQRYIGKPDDVFECQAELIEAGFEEFAKL